MFTKEYWENRVLKHGHTGHGDPFFYSFDQEARKFAIEEILRELGFQKKASALDFGCGSGDFLELLATHFKQVTGYDISENVLKIAAERYKGQAKISLTNAIQKPGEQTFDLILTVTVLQTMNPKELTQHLAMLRNKLSKNGYLVCMEFFTTEAWNQRLKEDKSTLKDWFILLKEHRLNLIAEKDFYDPTGAHAFSYQSYRRNPLVIGLKVFKHFKFAHKLWSKQARKIIRNKKDIFGDQNGIFKIYILQKSADQSS
jgi:ubiquinone/menaquinone biosynthesis C-methylase UbiE